MLCTYRGSLAKAYVVSFVGSYITSAMSADEVIIIAATIILPQGQLDAIIAEAADEDNFDEDITDEEATEEEGTTR